MKNHIKNYIKIMGLAAVPFETAQAWDYEIKMTQEHKPDAEHFRISFGGTGKNLCTAHIVWPHDKQYPNPIYKPDGFLRFYNEELMREEDILKDKFFLSSEVLRLEGLANVVEYARHYCGGEIDHFYGKPDSKEFYSEKLCRVLRLVHFEGMFERVSHALMMKKSGLEIVRDFQKNELVEKRWFKLRKRCELPHDCSYVCYTHTWYGGEVFLVKDSHHLFSDSEYVLVIYPPRRISDCKGRLLISSDIPTVLVNDSGFKHFTAYCATREILDRTAREKLCEGLFPGEFYHRLSDLTDCFIRVRSYANEQSVSDLKSLPVRDCFEVEGGRVTGVWLDCKHLDMDVSGHLFTSLLKIMEYAEVFKDPKARQDFEKRDGKKSVYQGAINMKLLGKLMKEEGKKKEKEDKVKKSEKDPFEIKQNKKDPFGEN